LISETSKHELLWGLLNSVLEKIDFVPELPIVWHYAGLLSLLQEDPTLIPRMDSKWVPPDDSKSREDCERVLSQLTKMTNLPQSGLSRLESVDVELYSKLTLIWRYNSFGHHTDIHALCMYDVTSMMSHSCGSSGVWHFGANDSFCLRARVALNPGDEISISYLADEDLFKSIPIRQEKTMGWLFTCSCVRCDGSGVDFSRGFRCPTCVIGSIYLSSLDIPSPCDSCNSILSPEELTQYTDLEKLYVERVVSIDKDDESDLTNVLAEARNLFSENNWIINALETHLCDKWKSSNSSHPLRVPYMQSRLGFLRKTFPIANYTTTWLLEELSDMYPEISSLSVGYIEKAYWSMRTLCGEDHPFTDAIQTKWSNKF
jgi:hypothetical protein